MSMLYAAYLSCAGKWEKSILTIQIRKKHSTEQEEVYEWLTHEELRSKLGQALADDLVDRHKTAESKLPGNLKGKFIRKKLVCKYEPLLLYRCQGSKIELIGPGTAIHMPAMKQPGIPTSRRERSSGSTAASLAFVMCNAESWSTRRP